MTRRLMKAGLVAVLALSFQISWTQLQLAQQPQQAAPAAAGGQQGARGGGQRGVVDPRVQQRTYVFTETKEFIPYALFVSSKVRKDKKNPLIVALHGLGGDLRSEKNPNRFGNAAPYQNDAGGRHIKLASANLKQ